MDNESPDKLPDAITALRRREFLHQIAATTSLLFLPLNAIPSNRNGLQERAGGSANALPSASNMATAAQAVLTSLSPDQRKRATFSLDDNERYDWDYVPRSREGVSLKQLEPAQRQFVTTLLSAGLSDRGLTKATTIISLEDILRQIEESTSRDPGRYYLTLFGQPATNVPWGWRFEGHHLSLNYTLVNDGHIAVTPSFFGANPAEVRHGPRKGLRTLAQEEDLARNLLTSLDGAQRQRAVISESAPGEILTGSSRKAEPLTPAGIKADALTEKQKEILMNLLGEYLSNMPPDIAAVRLDKVKSSGFGNIAFAWAGGSAPSERHYYRIQGPSFLLEYDNTQNNANHIHSVWRDFTGDFGLDLLARHYKDTHH